ncbi:MAG: preprotein translocase subunit SecA [Defluviitaleaceae bacterium]|nr:preprotein translocase subunit SecA [Defluviitaleaceae bacterium]
MGLIQKIFGNYSEKEIKRIKPIADKIESLEKDIKPLTDEELKLKTQEFKTRIENGETLDSILPEAFAVVREASFRVLSMRHFYVQLLGGIVLHMGRIAEMRTGEGKTLVATLPAYLNALKGNGVHIVTVNDYLAKRDSEEMSKLFEFLGLSTGCILNDLKPDERRAAYACDITYATNNELGFDYLRDNMVINKKDTVGRGLSYAIIDEVDSILIDEARTPLIISGQGSKSNALYSVADRFAKTLTKGRILNEQEALNPLTRAELEEEGDFIVDEKAKSVTLTEQGFVKAEKFFNLENYSDPINLEIQHHVNNALKANYNMHKDQNYVVQNEEIVIVDEFTGRLMAGRRYSDGLHQAIEAKENVKVNRESKTLATITFQNYFNKYVKKSGMTGTAMTEEGEFRTIYGMDVVQIPTNKPMIRKDYPDIVYRFERGKIKAVVEDIKKSHEKGQPVLVGTITIDKSEELSKHLKKEGIPHKVLNAKYHEKEAEIVADAGLKGAVTIATNMAGRGTDIKLGEGVAEVGGLKIIGTERHESRRIDNQLRGRSGRQGDPGESRFYLSLEDELMRLFGAERMMKLVDKMGMEDEPIEHSLLSKAIENAQKKVEGNNFGIRKHLLDYDQVMNEQREIMYGQRNKVLQGEDLREQIFGLIKNIVDSGVEQNITEDENVSEKVNIKNLNEYFFHLLQGELVNIPKEQLEKPNKEEIKKILTDRIVKKYEEKETEITKELLRELERVILLRVIDQRWTDHIDSMDQMRQGISLRSYAQRDPLVEYKFLSYEMFEELTTNIQLDTMKYLLNVKTTTPEQQRREDVKVTFTNKDTSLGKTPSKRAEPKVGRNDPCPCGSGLKYKFCHGKEA